jgi:cell division protein FtsL
MISERYRKLLNAIDDQYSSATPVATQNAYSPVYTEETPVYAPVDSTPVVEQTPQVTEYAPSQVAASIFTAEKLDRMAEEDFAPTVVVNEAPKTVVKAATVTQVSYSLSPLAKMVLAAFTALVVVMLTFIGINSQIIQRKTIRLKNLEEKKQELMERNEEIQRYIAELQTEDNVMQRATEAGLID